MLSLEWLKRDRLELSELARVLKQGSTVPRSYNARLRWLKDRVADGMLRVTRAPGEKLVTERATVKLSDLRVLADECGAWPEERELLTSFCREWAKWHPGGSILPEARINAIRPAAKSGPQKGSGKYVQADRRLFPEMRRIIREDGKGPDSAARRLIDRIPGAGEAESRIRRLARRYKREELGKGRSKMGVPSNNSTE